MYLALYIGVTKNLDNRLKTVLLLISVLVLSACGTESPVETDNSLESELRRNGKWPQEIVGILDIVDTGGYFDDTDYPAWAVGSLTTPNDLEGILINIEGRVFNAGGVDIDTERTVRIWVGEPSGSSVLYDTFFQVSKIEYE